MSVIKEKIFEEIRSIKEVRIRWLTNEVDSGGFREERESSTLQGG